jgi:HSP20 family protein
MSLIRWEPFSGIDEIFSRMPSGFNRWPSMFDAQTRAALEWKPSVDISETDGEYLVRAELPAVSKDDVHITVDDRMLTISGERKQQVEDKKEKVHRVETVYGKFTRSFTLPDNADASSIRAESRDGVITLHVAKTKVEPRKPTHIKIQ